MTIQQQITAKRKEITALNARKSAYETSRASWQRAVDQVACNQMLKKKREKCKDDRVFKVGKVNYAITQISAANAKISGLTADIAELHKKQEADNKAKEILAAQGTSLEAEVEKAKGYAQAEKEKVIAKAETDRLIANLEAQIKSKESEILSTAKAKAIDKQSTVEAEKTEESGDLTNKLLIGGAVLAAIVILFIVFMKFKK